MDTQFAHEEKEAYWEAFYYFVLFAQKMEQHILDWPAAHKGRELLGTYYTRAADLLAPVLWCANSDGGPINTLLTFAIITSAHLKESVHNPGSTVSLHTLAMQNYPHDVTDELWGEMQRILEAWKYGYFQPINYPATFEQTMNDDEDEQSSWPGAAGRA